jgi:hypothetical protein
MRQDTELLAELGAAFRPTRPAFFTPCVRELNGLPCLVDREARERPVADRLCGLAVRSGRAISSGKSSTRNRFRNVRSHRKACRSHGRGSMALTPGFRVLLSSTGMPTGLRRFWNGSSEPGRLTRFPGGHMGKPCPNERNDHAPPGAPAHGSRPFASLLRRGGQRVLLRKDCKRRSFPDLLGFARPFIPSSSCRPDTPLRAERIGGWISQATGWTPNDPPLS